MSDRVIVRLSAAPGEILGWAAFSGADIDATGHASTLAVFAQSAAEFLDTAELIAVLPGEQAAMRILPAPPRQMPKLLSAAQLLLEDELAMAIDAHHVAVMRKGARAAVAAVSRDLIVKWRDAFEEAALTLSMLTVDFCCLGVNEGEGVLFITRDRVIGDIDGEGFAVEPDLAELVIADRLASLPEATLAVYDGKGAEPAVDAKYEKRGEADDAALFSLVSKAVEKETALNFLQGEFKPKKKLFPDGARWRRPAMIAAALAVFMLAAVVADGMRASRLAARYEDEAARIHAEALPDAPRGDIRAHARAVLSGAGGDASFMTLSAALSDALAQHESVSIDRMRFDSERSQFTFSIRSVSDAEIEAFRNSLGALGATASETGGYRRSGDYWIGEMTVNV